MKDQTAKADGGKLRLTLVPTEAVEAVAAIRMYGVQKYTDKNNWKRVEKERYKDAALRHFIRYCREPYGMDDESNLPHLWHCLCNLFFLCSLEIQDGTLPQPQDAVKKMTRCEPVQARRSPATGKDVYLFAEELKTARTGVERCCETCKHGFKLLSSDPCVVCDIKWNKWEKKDEKAD